jgi:predicted nucleic acid-binding Zn ribbon protein
MTDRNGRRGRDDPRPLGDALADVSKHLHMPAPRTLSGVFGAWDDVVGASMAAHVQPRTLRDGVLTLVVDDPVWATQLRFLEGDLLRRIERLAGPDAVQSLRIVVQGRKRRS